MTRDDAERNPEDSQAEQGVRGRLADREYRLSAPDELTEVDGDPMMGPAGSVAESPRGGGSSERETGTLPPDTAPPASVAERRAEVGLPPEDENEEPRKDQQNRSS